MFLTKEAQQKHRNQMKRAMKLANRAECNIKIIHSVLSRIFYNELLRFIIIDQKMYVAHVRLHLRGGLFLRYQNPHQWEHALRIDYDKKNQTLFLEEVKLVPHPFTYGQRISPDQMVGVMLHGYEACGFTDPNEKVEAWNSTGVIFPISNITSFEIIPFEDKPAVWVVGDDLTAYKVVISTK